ncbi:unnamed protein product [Larinioides sclopetarius]|uniref:Uncharacterized protein n=1 Tax=Larinioides sclopetarius TaxID=280406 RepID=A0AAV1ZKF3_9ARAC
MQSGNEFLISITYSPEFMSGIPDPRPDCVELHQPRFSPRQVVEHSPHTDCRTY